MKEVGKSGDCSGLVLGCVDPIGRSGRKSLCNFSIPMARSECERQEPGFIGIRQEEGSPPFSIVA